MDLKQILCLSNLIDKLKILLIILIVALLIWACAKNKEIFQFVKIVCVLGLFVSAIFSSVYTFNYYTKEGGTFGEITNTIFNNSATITKSDEYTFTYSKIGFLATDDETNQYQSKFTDTRNIEIDLSKNWKVFINGQECDNSSIINNEITAQFTNSFVNKDKEIILTDTLEISIIFNKYNISFDNEGKQVYKQNFDVYIVTNGGEDAVKLWNTYLEKNGFTLQLKISDEVKDNILSIDKLAETMELTFEDGTKTALMVGSELNLFNTLYANGYIEKKDLITSIKLPEGVKTITDFSICSKLSFIEFNNNLITISSNCFSGNKAINNIKIIGTTTIKTNAFNGVTNLSTIEISKNVIIENCAFRDTNLSKIVFEGTIEELNQTNWYSQILKNKWYLNDSSSMTQITIQCTDGNITI